ncbi:MAG: DUF58 domain-containing protein [Chloroflexi bacterium]|nr:DUF58 domain-containing protein [Chloroflexota bacterium]MDA1146552.1 DUF58 domain-containing protein [Chloroflexota bacterium]MQC82758.1 DUF58 domain-containing protein [Chloroflexota bacterium]PKB56753.1 MAG: hypothetical protein BZY69_00115 [SAR202 cluster bacterium Casp-Chloro-G1]
MRTLVDDSWLLGSSILIGVGLLTSSPVVIILGMLVLGSSTAGRLWARISLEDVHYEREISEHRLFVGEKAVLTIRLANRKAFPVPWIEVREQLPRDLVVTRGRTFAGGTPGVSILQRNTALGRHDHLEWPVEVQATKRGYYRIGPTRLRSGDIFGFFERELTPEIPATTLVVYPQTYALPELGLDSARPFGELRGGNRIYEDPSRVVGVRDYQPGDPMKRIDWNATARVQRLQSRLYEPSRAQAIVVALNVGTFARSWQGSDPIVLERGISVAASVARWAYEADLAVGVIANGAFPGQGRPIRLGVGRHPDRLNRVLEALAAVSAFTISSLARELEGASTGALPAGSTVVVVAAVMPEELVATLHRLRREGHFVHIVKTSEAPWDAALGRIPVSEVAAQMEELEAALARELGDLTTTVLAGDRPDPTPEPAAGPARERTEAAT